MKNKYGGVKIFMYYIGDRVKIVENLQELKDNGEDITPEMLEYAGMYSIVMVRFAGINTNRYLLNIDNKEWLWSENLLY